MGQRASREKPHVEFNGVRVRYSYVSILMHPLLLSVVYCVHERQTHVYLCVDDSSSRNEAGFDSVVLWYGNYGSRK